MIRRVIGQDHAVPPPAFPRIIQQRAQLLEEEAHGLGVVVALAHRIINVPQGVESDSQRDSGRQLLLGLRVLFANLAPGPSSIISFIQPAFIDIDDGLVLNVLPQESLRPGLTLMDVHVGVHVQCLLSYPAVLHL